MSGAWGKNIQYSIFGESHGPSIGIVISGLPAGIKLDMDLIYFEMQRRRPGKDALSTSRNEKDKINILSGYFNNRTTGSPLCVTIDNTDTKSNHYDKVKAVMRPSHADFTAHVKYSGFNDYRGGGHFSGRITAPLVLAGAIAKQILSNNHNIVIGSHISQIGDFEDLPFDNVNMDESVLKKLHKQPFPVLDNDISEKMQKHILTLREKGDSTGGSIETIILNIPTGTGSPFFDSIESNISHIMFSIPAVKGIEFGCGFSYANMLGSEANDEYYYDGNTVKTYTNNNGGILGGISTGMPISFKVAVKPTPSISLSQRTINITDNSNTTLNIEGRHDPCIVHRAIPVIEAGAAMGILDLLVNRR